MSTIVSIASPRRKSSNNNSDLNSNQGTLKGVMKDELGSQTWQFPTDVFVRMLSPKTPHNPENPEANIYLEDFDCYTDTEVFQDAYERAKAPFLDDYLGPGSVFWPEDTKKDGKKSSLDEKNYYEPMKDFLNQTIACCRDALDDGSEYLFQNILFFNTHNKSTMDVAKGSENLKPDLVLEETDDWPIDEKERVKLEGKRLWWCKPNDESRQITLVCEVKEKWAEMVSQLATYARCQFDACPSRLFVLAIGFNHKSSEARFIIFHRSGLTASPALVLTDEIAKLDFLKIFMTVMSWKEGRDAGFSDSNNNNSYNLGNETWNITGKLHHTSCVRGRATIVNILELNTTGTPDLSAVTVVPQSETVNGRKRKSTEGDGKPSKSTRRRTGGGPSGILATIAEDSKGSNSPGTSDKRIAPNNFCFPIKARGPPDHYLQADHPKDSADGKVTKIVMKECHAIKGRTNVEGESLGYKGNKFGVANIRATYKACYSTGQLQSTSIYLPKDEDAAAHYYHVFDEFQVGVPEPRTRVLVEMTSLGKSFLNVEPGKTMATCVAHSMLGWLNVYQHGFLHRDVSIGNVLAFVEKPEEREPFQLTDEFKASLGGVTMQMLNDKLRDLGLNQSKDTLIPDAASWATKLEQLLEAHNIGTSCMAFIIDGDLAKDWEYMFDNWREQKESIKRERSGTDLFMSNNLVGKANNEYIQSPSDDIESFMWVTLYAKLNNNIVRPSPKEKEWADECEKNNRNYTLEQFGSEPEDAVGMNGLMYRWAQVVRELSRGYKILLNTFSIISGKDGWESDEEEAKYWRIAWHGYALQGVCQSLELILAY